MKRVDRANYVKDGRYAYEDSPQYVDHLRELGRGTEVGIVRPIGFGATISAPHMVSGSNLGLGLLRPSPICSPAHHTCVSWSHLTILTFPCDAVRCRSFALSCDTIACACLPVSPSMDQARSAYSRRRLRIGIHRSGLPSPPQFSGPAPTHGLDCKCIFFGYTDHGRSCWH